LIVSSPQIPAIGFVAYSGTGKTTLIEQLIAYLTGQGYKISVIKHTHHRFDIDRPGKDSFRHRESGATEVMLVSDQRWVLMHELRDTQEPSIEEQLSKISPCDLVIVEGFKQAAIKKIELWRHDHPESAQQNLRATTDTHVQAVAIPGGAQSTHQPNWETIGRAVSILDLDKIDEVAAYVVSICGLKPKNRMES
jgi:molybdopterin-guanine dinucleotide biosynthesis protein B